LSSRKIFAQSKALDKMDPLTQIVVSIAASRACLNKISRLATPMLIVTSVAADLDWLTALAGPRVFLLGHRTITDSICGAAAIAILTAIIFTIGTRKHSSSPINFLRALFVCAIGSLLHVLFDLTNSYGVKLFWPLSDKWYALDSVSQFDVIILVIFAAGILFPMLFRLVGEEIGAQRKTKGVFSAVFAFVLVFAYVGARCVLHDRAVTLVNSRLYNGAPPLAAGAFPNSPSPFHWAGVIITESNLLRAEVPVVIGKYDPFAAKTFYKPEESPALDAARASSTASLFLSFARFPRAHVERNDRGYHIEITDMRFEVGTPPGHSMMAAIDVDENAHVTHEELKFGDLFQK
jgi:inner membrane protein